MDAASSLTTHRMRHVLHPAQLTCYRVVAREVQHHVRGVPCALLCGRCVTLCVPGPFGGRSVVARDALDAFHVAPAHANESGAFHVGDAQSLF